MHLMYMLADETRLRWCALCLQQNLQNTYDREASQTHYFFELSSKVCTGINDSAQFCFMPFKFPSVMLYIFFISIIKQIGFSKRVLFL